MKPVMEKMNFSDITYNIMIFHSPDFAFDKNGLRPRKTIGLENVNLGVSGHNHGGLVPKLLEPLNIGLLSPGKELFPHNVAGLFSRSDEEFKVLISRGIQKIPGTVIKEMGALGNLLYRLNQVYRPDIDLLSIEPKKKIYHM